MPKNESKKKSKEEFWILFLMQGKAAQNSNFELKI